MAEKAKETKKKKAGNKERTANGKQTGVKKSESKNKKESKAPKAKRAKTEDKVKNAKSVASKEKKRETQVVYAHAKYINLSPQKTRLVVDMVRGRNAKEASHELEFINKRSSGAVKKCVDSAVANAVNNFELDEKNLAIVDAYVNEAPTFKRGRSGSRGRYKKILKRNCHISIGVSEKKFN